jgi:RNA polymerase sigma-70 factor (ECF subfamily)
MQPDSAYHPEAERFPCPDVMSDLALVRRLLAGDEAAFESFFADYFPRLYRFARVRLSGNDDAAEDVVQAVLVKAVEKLATYRGDAALFTWLCTLCRHEIAAWLERAGKTSEIPLVEDHPDIRAAVEALAAFTSDDPELALRRTELSRLVQLTLDHLPARYGDVLEWKYIQELSVDEIAERLGIGYKAAESLLTRARRAFREGFAILEGA